MCLTTVYKTKPKDSGTGYKAVVQTDDGTAFRTSIKEVRFKLKEEVIEPLPDRLITAGSNSYPAGFHIFKTLQAAKDWALLSTWTTNTFEYILKVNYSQAVAHGVQKHQKVHQSSIRDITHQVVVARRFTATRIVRRPTCG